ncbi:MAG: sugar transferase [Paludibacteraceae bacterium]|nr:sugar transferase [Paludibacteraceae bacterium]
MNKFRFNKAKIVADIIFWLITAFVVWSYRVMTDKIYVNEYVIMLICMMFVWLLLSLVTGRYKKEYGRYSFVKRVCRLMVTTLVFALLSAFFVIKYTHNNCTHTMAGDVFFWAIVIVGILCFIYEFVSSAYRYAQDIDNEPQSYSPSREPQTLCVEKETLSESEYNGLLHGIKENIGEDGLNFLKQNVDLTVNTTKCLSTSSLFNFQSLRVNRYDTIVNLMPLNTIRGINKLFCTANSKLPDNGRFFCCFTPQEIIKKEIFSRYPRVINRLVYAAYFLYRRVFPRMFFSRRLYFDFTKGKKRVFSKTEILGRLYYCGFAVDEVFEFGRMVGVLSHRVKQPEPQSPRKIYGVMIRLPRIGKDYNIVYVYKMRTMHPYAEYIQQYVYEKKGLQEGGKFADDERITTIGKFLRKYWLDELPMLFNVIRGDMKLIGVRPLSRQYFSIYPEEVQLLRTRFLPGMFPPFYVDMPKTKDEIFASEKRYLEQYAAHPVKTDFKYFFLILRNIFFRKARSH